MKKILLTLSSVIMILNACASSKESVSDKVGKETEPSVFPQKTTLLNKTSLNGGTRQIMVYDDFITVTHHGSMMATICDADGNILSRLPYNIDQGALGGYWVVRKDNTLFVAVRIGDPALANDGGGGIFAWDVSNPAKPVQLGHIIFPAPADVTQLSPQPTTIDLFHQGKRDYLAIAGNAYAGGGFAVVDVTDPKSMELTGGIVYTKSGEGGDVYMRPHGLVVLDNKTVATGNYTSYRKFGIIDVSNPAVPTHLSAVNDYMLGDEQKGTLGLLWGVARLDEDHVAAASFTLRTNANDNIGWLGVRIFNIADRKAPYLAGSCRLDWSVVDRSAAWDMPPSELICVSKGDKDYILLNGGDKGIHVIDATDRSNPVFLYNSAPDGFGNDCVRAVAVSPDKSKLYLGSGPFPAGGKALWVSEIEWGK